MSVFQSYFDACEAYIDGASFQELSAVSFGGFDRIEDQPDTNPQREEALGPGLFDWVVWFSASAVDLLTASLPVEMGAPGAVPAAAGDLGPGAEAGRGAVDGMLESSMSTKMTVDMLRSQVGISPTPPGFMP